MHTSFSSKKHFVIPLLIGVIILAVPLIFWGVTSHDCENNYELISTENATCTQEGTEVYQCTKCDKTKEVTIPKIDHAYDLTSSSQATCTTDGIEVFTCSVCADTYQNTTAAALGHNFVTDAAVTPTCLNTGLTEGFHCIRCEHKIPQEVVDALGHNMVTDVAVAPTCLNTGLTEGSHCTRCEHKMAQEVVDALGHDMVTDVAVAPTCLNTGLTEGSHCTRCGHKIAQEVVDALGHNMAVVSETPANCTTDGLSIKKCTRCDERTEETLTKLGHNIVIDAAVKPGCLNTGLTEGSHCTRCEHKVEQQVLDALGHQATGWATIFEACVCARCNTILHPKLDHELDINYNYGFATDYKTISVATQDRTLHNLGSYNFYQTSSPVPGSEITFNESISLQDFYTHSLLTAKGVTTNDGKHFYVNGGFKVSFSFPSLDDTLYKNGGMDIINHSDFTSQFESDSILKIVKSGKSADGFYKIYQVVDFAHSYIEISKLVDGEYVTAATVSTVNDWNSILDLKEIVFSDKNGKLFSEAGTYRIMFKFSVAWFIESSNGNIYNASGEICYPYGILNDQFDYFYITVTDETYNILLPDDLDETKDMFYQISMDDINNGRPYIKSGETVEVTDDIDLIFDSKIGYWDEQHRYQGKLLTKWSMDCFTYNNTSESYAKKHSYDLLDSLSTSGTGKVKISKSLLTGYCKIEINYTLYDPITEEESSYTDIYYLYIE
ncbi:MAG: hypothetical protein J6S23_08890 [Clostridia bacterium]|nr:hypothetical protein [Clostridia bacterium]